jgi:SAM-dependent methyltransferase
MILSELVDYLNQLDAVIADPLHATAREGLDRALHTITAHKSISWPKMYRSLHENSRQLDTVYQDFTHNVNTLRSHARNLIAETEPDYYRASTQLWQNEMIHETAEYQLNRRLNASTESHEKILGRVLRWSDWQYPGMVLGPKRYDWVDHLVGLDPLYLVDTAQELLAPAQQRFPAAYQQRLRLYSVSDRLPRQILQALPDGQFSMVFAYDFFNYRPFEILCKWISEIFHKLRPGGSLFFTFNDCDFAQGVALTERHFMCYTPGHRVEQHLRETGFEIQERCRAPADLAWIEAVKPGRLETMRAGQNLAKIVARSK